MTVDARLRSSDLALTVGELGSSVLVEVIPMRGNEEIAAQTRVEMAGDRLIIETPKTVGRLFRSTGPVRVRVQVPPGSSLDADTGSGDVRVRGFLVESKIRSGSGDLELDAAREAEISLGSGDLILENVETLRATSGSGDIRVGTARGPAWLRAGSGDVIVDRAGDVTCGTGSGDVVLGTVDGAATVSTGSGAVTIRHAVSGQIRAKAASGTVSVGVPLDTAALLDCGSVSGRVTSDLVAGDAPGEAEKGVVLHIRTTSGDIRIQRA